jgi:hypothetical protein
MIQAAKAASLSMSAAASWKERAHTTVQAGGKTLIMSRPIKASSSTSNTRGGCSTTGK